MSRLTLKSYRPMRLIKLCALVMLAGAAVPALAVPSFARQTGLACSACHTIFPELTPFGREFKLNGYTLDNLRQITGETMQRRQTLSLNRIAPISAMLQVSYTHTAKALPDSAVSGALAKNGDVLFPQQMSLFYAGKIANGLGAFMQITYDGAEDHLALDNTDIRYTHYLGIDEPVDASNASERRTFLQRHDILLGLTLNNNPTVQDPWNSTPAWGFPYSSSSVAPQPNASTILDTGAGGIGQDAAGLGAYLWFDQSLYAEFSLYTAAKVGGAHPLDSTQAPVLQGVAPYWRVGYQYDWNRNSLFLGTFGTDMHIRPADGHPLSGIDDNYTDVAVDSEYQYISSENQVTVLATYMHEHQDLAASYLYGVSSNPTNDLNTVKLVGEYSYRRTLGGAAGWFSTSGSADPLLYANDGTVNGSLAGSPDSRGYILELNYVPFLNTKLQLQYVGYTRFNGSGTDYAGTGRNASDNNTLYLLVWLNY